MPAVPDAAPRPLLPPGALEVLRLLAAGHSEREAALLMHYSYSYARRLAAEACEALGAVNTRNAIYLAARLRLI